MSINAQKGKKAFVVTILVPITQFREPLKIYEQACHISISHLSTIAYCKSGMLPSQKHRGQDWQRRQFLVENKLLLKLRQKLVFRSDEY